MITTHPTYPCRVAIERGVLTRTVWVESPRTGKRLTFSAGDFFWMPEAVRQKIERVRRGTVEFTGAELREIVAAHQRARAAK